MNNNIENHFFIDADYEEIEQANKGLRRIPIKRKNKETGEVTTKNYVPVSERIKAFRKVYPVGFINTEIELEDDNKCRFKATIYQYYDGPVLAVARAEENRNNGLINKTSLIENCETSAVGRALGMCGFGIDNDLASAEEVQNAVSQQDYLEDKEMTEEQIKIIAKMDADLKDTIRKFYGKDPLKLNYKQAKEAIESAMKRNLIKSPKDEKIEKIEKEIEEKNEEDVF